MEMSADDEIQVIRGMVEAKFAAKDHIPVPPEELKRLQIVLGQIWKGKEREQRLRAVSRIFPVGPLEPVTSCHHLSLGQSLALRERLMGTLMMEPGASLSGDAKDLMLELAK